jgi:hypothetical protein
LAFARVKIAELVDQIPVAPRGRGHEVSAPFFRDTGGFVAEKARNGFIAR